MKVVSLTLLVVAVVLGVCACGTFAQVEDTTPYTPGPQVRRWATGDLVLTTNIDELLPYVESIAYNRAIPYLAVGVIAILAILIWSCCRCCNKCHVGLKDGSFCGKIWFLLLLVVMVCSIGLAAGGIEASKDQNTAFVNFPTVIDSVTSYVMEVGTSTDEVDTRTGILVPLLEELQEVQYNMFIDSNQVQAMIDFVETLNTTVASVDSSVGGLDFSTFSDISNESGNVNDIRNQYSLIVLGVILGLVLLEGFFAILNFCLSGSSRPSHNACRFIIYFLSFLTLLVLLVLWVAGGGLIVASTVVSDVCLDPDSQFLSLVNETGVQGQAYELATYYLTCDVGSPAHPFRTEIRNISNAINQTLEELETTKSDVDDCATLLGASDPRCVRAELVIEYIQTNTTALELELGTAPSLIDENGNSSEGFLYLVSCSALNGRYQNMLNVFCGDGAEALGLSAGIFVGFALIYLFSQIISRIVSDVGRDEDDDVKII
eukprot:m.94726 g.94726  ORF g.94726 m.94726 type:complete len:489 (-) comp12420_c0_seq7:3304-4770(-)